MKMECIHRKENIQMDLNFYPDIKVYCMDGTYRMAHRIIISRLSHLLEAVLKSNEDEEDIAIILPDIPGQMIDLMLELAYFGLVGGLGLNNISQVRDVCKILDITQSDFVVRSEEKSASARSDVKTESSSSKTEQIQTESAVQSGTEKRRENAHENAATEDESDDEHYDEGEVGGIETSPQRIAEEESSSYAPEFSDSRSKDQQGAFQCESCNKTFIFAKSFERHQEVCHARIAGGKKRPKPRKCKRKVRKEEILSDEENENLLERDKKSVIVFKFQHYEEIDDEYFCKFPGCDYKAGFKTLENCKNHQLLLHASDKQKLYSCDVCSKKFASNRLRNKHMNLMHIKRFECDICNKKCSEMTQLKIHRRIHTGEKPYVCQLCGYSCTQRSNLRKHNEIKHSTTDANKFTCDICDTSFNTKSNLTRHKRLHENSQLPIICEKCGKKFKDKGGLNQHLFSHGPAQFNCTQCDAKFTSPLYLFRHTSRKHPEGGVQPFTCQLCGKGFPVNHQLQIHIQAVHEKLKHSCPNCNQLMGRKNSLYRHLKNGKCPGMTSIDGPGSIHNISSLLKPDQHHSTDDTGNLQLEPLSIAGDPTLAGGQVSIENSVSVLNLDPDGIPVAGTTGGGQVQMTADDMLSGLADMADLGTVVTGSTTGSDIVPSYQMLVAQQFIIYPKSNNSSQR